MTRFWISWWSGNYAEDGCTEPPFQYWLTGQRDRPYYGMGKEKYEAMVNAKLDDAATDDYIDQHGKDDCSFVAMVDAEKEEDIWEVIKKNFPDYEQRFCEVQEPDCKPGNRFLNFENRTSLTGENNG